MTVMPPLNPQSLTNDLFFNSMDDNDFPFDTSTVFSKLSDSDIVYTRKEPKVIGSYLFGEVLGKGAYGKVKEAANILTRQKVAIKIINKKQLRKIPGGEENVRQEIEMQHQLFHPNIVKLFESFTIPEKNKMYIVLEYIGGGSVQDLLEVAPNSRLPVPQAQNYFRQLVDAIEYLHKMKIIHRDVKPGNLLITLDGQVKLTDFGVAQWADKTDTSSITQGSPAFQPPEVASGKQLCSGFEGDIWAAGVTLYFMITGNLPFFGTTIYVLFEAISKGEFTMPDCFDDSLKSMLSGLLEIDEKKRFTIPQIRSHPWFSADLRPEDWIPLQVSTTSFTEDENGLVVLPTISPASLPTDNLGDPSILPSLKSDKSYKEKCHCVIH